MPRLCSDSSRPYPGRSARRGDVLLLVEKLPVRPLVYQAWAYRFAVDRYEQNRQQDNSRNIAHHVATYDVIGQKSAEAIVAQRPG